MSDQMAKRFAEALQHTEQSGDVESVVQLFAPDASLRRPERGVEKQGQEAIRDFWKAYLDSFDTIRSRFDSIRQCDGLCVLEWTSEATWKSGRKVNYRGVTLLEVADDRVQKFATYYDTAALADLTHARK